MLYDVAPRFLSNPTIGGGRGWALCVPFIEGGAIERAPPGDVFLLTPTGMSLVWGKLVHPLTGYSIPPPKGALLVTPPMQWGIYFDHPLPPPIVGLLFLVFELYFGPIVLCLPYQYI